MNERVIIELLASCDSTHDLARERLGTDQRVVAIQSLSQRVGRGREGRMWIDDGGAGGCLLLSLALLRPGNVELLDGLSVRIATSITRSLADVGVLGLGVKHPNDLVTPIGEKVGGVLVDATTMGDVIEHMVLSIGMNVTWSPDLSGQSTACLADIGVPPELSALAHLVANAMLDAVIER